MARSGVFQNYRFLFEQRLGGGIGMVQSYRLGNNRMATPLHFTPHNFSLTPTVPLQHP
jgi:hypothetical protein